MFSIMFPLPRWGWLGDALRVLLPMWSQLGMLGVQRSGQNGGEKPMLQREVGKAAKPRFPQLSLIRAQHAPSKQ